MVYKNDFDYHCRYHHVYCDNYFSSVDLCCDLERTGLNLCGTLRQNRKGFPEQFLKHCKNNGKFGNRGDTLIVQCANLTISLLWQDNEAVKLISNMSDPTITTNSVKRTQKDGTKITLNCPDVVIDYNRYMGGVDWNDQLRGYYYLRLKSRKIYK